MLTETKNEEIPEILDAIPEHQSALVKTLISEKNTKINSLETQLEKAQAEINWFKEQFKIQQQRLFGRSTETSDTLQMGWFFNEAGLLAESQETSETEESLTEDIFYTRKKAKTCGRKLNTAQLPRERHCYDLSDAEKICDCGHTLEKMGEDISEQIEHIPEQLKVIEHVRCKYTCRFCETIKAAEKPESVIPKSMAGAGLIAEVMIKKYEHHLPLYRQSKIFLQQGCDIPANTLGNWVMQGAEALEPLGTALWQQLPQVHMLQADETPVKVLEPDKQGYLWGYHSCDPANRFITFEFHLTRSGEVVNQRLNHYQGILQTDGYSGYNGMRNRADVITIGCWDHARRKFTDVIKINNNNATGQAGMLLSLINKLYQVEAEAKGKSFVERQQLRQEKAKPILEKIHERLLKINAPPKVRWVKQLRIPLTSGRI